MTEEKELALLKRIRANAQRVSTDCDALINENEDTRQPFDDMTEEEKAWFIIDNVAEFYGETRKTILRSSSAQHLIARKKYIIKLMYEMAGMDYQSIADLIGLTSHATVMHHHRDINEQLEDHPLTDGRVRARYKAILKYLNFD